MFQFIKRLFGTAQERTVRRFKKVVSEINTCQQNLQPLSDNEIKAKTEEFRKRLANGETLEQILPEAFAVVKEACRRLCGTEIHVSGYDQKWDMVPYDVQLIGGIAMHSGCIAEMQTGEGKTLTATLPLYLNALSGKSVHLVTVNDYLAERDCQWVGTILRWLGLTTGALTTDTPTEKRKALYECDVLYGTAAEFGFDYLRDNSMAHRKEDQVQRDHFFAIIDEVDSILIDEARTPLIISGPVPESRQMYDQLKDSVGVLVRRQRDFCNRLASEAKKILEQPNVNLNNKEAEEALRKLWLVGKGTPQNKVLKRLKEEPDIRAGIDSWDLYYYSDQNKEERHKAIADLYITVEEKASEFEVTDKGIHAWQECTSDSSSNDFVMMDISHEYMLIDEDLTLDDEAKMQRKLAVQQEDIHRKERAHNLRQLLRAHLMMERDIDYMVQDGKVIIVDENTGRPQPGRRFSDGLHQAIEAKEGVAIQQETQTYATITLQNYFRMYDKISGMTGTAITEAGEFKEIYKLDVLEIPTHNKCIRTDFNDEIYMSEREKYNALLKDIREVHNAGRPILIGTESVEVSEKLSRILKQNNLPHTVLNAKNHAKEAEIIAEAGQRAVITVATNMAGRGTDIKLGQGIALIGGLYVVGTTRHQSRRIDRQLRGRCARQGDPGSSKFFVSFEDSLMRLFASPRLTAVLQKFRPPEGEPISARMLNKSIETAQKRVEQRNYTIRKHTLEYDDVMNKQRHEIYDFRNDILHRENTLEIAVELLHTVCHAAAADKFLSSKGQEGGWEPEAYRQWLMSVFPVSFEPGAFDDDIKETDELAEIAAEKIISAFNEKMARETKKIHPAPGLPRDAAIHRALRDLMIRRLDQLWQEHLLAMDHLRTDVSLRTVGQRDPLMEFKHEAFRLFDELGRKLRSNIAHDVFRFELVAHEDHNTLQKLLGQLQLERGRSLAPQDQEQLQQQQESQESGSERPKGTPVTVPPQPHRNDVCPCGSGKKYKKCCGLNKDAEE